MVNLEAIKYWIHTARAPCLYEYDRVSQKHTTNALQNCESARSSINLKEDVIVSSSRRKRKKKLLAKLTSSSSSNKNFVYFEKSSGTNNRKATFVSEGSELTKSYLNVRNHKDGIIEISHSEEIFHCTNVSRKNINNEHNIITSTPINHKNILNHNELKPFKGISQKFTNNIIETSQNNFKRHSTNRSYQDRAQRTHANSTGKLINIDNSRNKLQNSMFDDISDVSGFTANYIRSTKLMSAKNRKQVLKTRKVSNKLNRCNHGIDTNHESLNQNFTIHVHNKSSVRKTNKSFPKNRTAETTNISENNNTNSFLNITTCGSSIEKISERNRLRRYETNHSSSSEDELIFVQRSRSKVKNTRLRRNRILQNNSKKQKLLYTKNKLEKQAGTMFYKPKKSILGQSNGKEVDNSCTTMNKLKSKEEMNMKNQLHYGERVNKQNVVNRENGVINKQHSLVLQNKTKSNNNTNVYFSDCDSDVPSEKHKYFG